MGVCLYLLLNPHDPAITSRLDGKALFSVLPDLDELAVALGVCTLQSFMDSRPVPGLAHDIPDILTDPDAFQHWADAMESALVEDEAANPCDEWFAPAELLATVVALERRLSAVEKSSARDVRNELRELARILQVAIETGAAVRLDAQ